MKKFFGALVAMMCMGLAACGNEQPAAPVTPVAPKTCWTITGPDCLKVDGKTAAEAEGKSWGYGGDSFQLKDVTLDEVKEIDATVGAKLEAKKAKVKALHVIEKVTVGVDDAGYSKKFLNDEKELYEANGSFTLKVIHWTYDSKLDMWADAKWVPDPKKAHVENLANYFVPTFQEDKDEYGFSWADDSVVTAGAGVYTLILAEYTEGPSKELCNYGIAMVKTQDLEGEEYVKVEDWVKDAHTYGLVGDFNGWSAADSVQMSKDEDSGKYVKQYTFDNDAQVKICADGEWTNSWGYDSVVEPGEFVSKVGENMGLKAGTYEFTIDFDGNTALITVEELK